jgi:hypothetical protein
MDEEAKISTVVALALIDRAAKRADNAMDDENNDRQIILEKLIATINEIIGRVE